MTNEEKKKFCAGCYNDFYNYGGVNGNTLACWSLAKATPVKRKEVHVSSIPPFKHQRIIEVNDCYKKPQYVYIEPEREY